MRTARWAANVWREPQVIRIESIGAGVRALRAIQRNWWLYPTGHYRRAALLQEQLPHVAARPLHYGDAPPAAPLGSWTMLDPNTLLAAPRCTSPFPNGVVQFVQDREGPPNRAYLKLWEAWARLRCWPQPGERCVDLGSSPGGWTFALQRTGAEVLAFADVDGLVCDGHLSDGDVVEATEFTLRTVHTPGHASNHLCFLLERDRMLFAGDHVMDASTVVINPPDGDMTAYMRSLERLLAWSPQLRTIAPAHGHLIEDPRSRLEYYISHRMEREQQVLDGLKQVDGPVGTAELVEAIYADVPQVLHPVARRSVWAHLRKLADEGRVESPDPDDPDALWAMR